MTLRPFDGPTCLIRRPRRGIGFPQFSDDEVLAIRRAWETGTSIVTLAAQHGVHRMTIAGVVHYERYSHIEPEIAA